MLALPTLIAIMLSTVFPPPQPSISSTMKAVRYHAAGGPEVLVYEDAPRPTLQPGQVLVKVHAAGVNPVDWKRRTNSTGPFPITPGYDLSGVVSEIAPDVKDLKVGDEVYGMMALARSGAYAQYVAVQAIDLAIKPKSIDHVHAAAVPLVTLTAWQAMFDAAKLKSGQTILIHAGAGGVGHVAIQLAKAKGAKVIATASEGNLQFLKDLGADAVIDYKARRFENVAKNVDVVFDTVGGDTLQRSYTVPKEGGYLVSIVESVDAEKLKAHNIEGSRILVKPNASQLVEITSLIEAEKLKVHVSTTLPLSEARKAQEMSFSGRTRGKIVLTVD